jgi:hypothetical protein
MPVLTASSVTDSGESRFSSAALSTESSCHNSLHHDNTSPSSLLLTADVTGSGKVVSCGLSRGQQLDVDASAASPPFSSLANNHGQWFALSDTTTSSIAHPHPPTPPSLVHPLQSAAGSCILPVFHSVIPNVATGHSVRRQRSGTGLSTLEIDHNCDAAVTRHRPLQGQGRSRRQSQPLPDGKFEQGFNNGANLGTTSHSLILATDAGGAMWPWASTSSVSPAWERPAGLDQRDAFRQRGFAPAVEANTIDSLATSNCKADVGQNVVFYLWQIFGKDPLPLVHESTMVGSHLPTSLL